MSDIGAPLSREELLEMVRLLRISFRNTNARRDIKSRDLAYRQAAKLLELVERAPDVVRLEIRDARAAMKEPRD